MWKSFVSLLFPATAILKTLKEIKMNQTELAAQLADVKATLVKANAEVVAKIANLEEKIEQSGQVDPAVLDALAELKIAAKAVDDIIPDAPSEPEPQPE
jgi:hypothetical protein